MNKVITLLLITPWLTMPNVQIPDNIDDFIHTFRSSNFPDQLLNDQTFTQSILNYLVTLPHTKDNPIFAAAKLGTPGAIEWLRRHLKDPVSLEIAEQELIIACQNNDVRVLDALISAGVSPEAQTRSCGAYCLSFQYSALMVAIQNGSWQAFESLLQAGADPNKHCSCYEKTALLMATRYRRIPMIDKLLQVGADPAVKDRGGTNITYYAYYGFSREMSELLTKYGYPYFTPIDHDGNGYAVGRRSVYYDPSCEDLKSQISCLANCYNIALFKLFSDDAISYISRYSEAIPWLLDQCQALPHCKDNIIFTLAHLSHRNWNQESLVKMLTDYLQDPEHMKQAEQELIIASGNNDTTVISVLLAARVSPNACSKSGLTALANALERNAYEAARLLKYEFYAHDVIHIQPQI